jgi:dienelactone hydrolase
MNSYCDSSASDGSGSMKAYLAMPAGEPKAGIVVIQEKSWALTRTSAP